MKKLVKLLFIASSLCGLGICQCPTDTTGTGTVDAVRLTGQWEHSFRGRAEVRMDGIWGVMCDANYTDKEAMTICRQLQCEGGRKDTSKPGTFTANLTSHSFSCNGTESSLNACSWQGWSCSGCDYHNTDTICTPGTGEPQSVHMSNPSQDSFVVNWEPPPAAACQLIEGYRVLCWKEGDSTVIVHSQNSSRDVRSVLVSGLIPYTSYKCCVASYNSRGGSERIQCSSTRTLAVYPSSPREVVSEDILATSVSVSWVRPEFVNGSVLHYVVKCFHTEGIYQTAVRKVSNELSTTTVSGVHPYANYTCCVSATNFVGQGPLKCDAEFQTAEAVPGAAPQNILVNTSSSSVTLSWGPPPKEQQNGPITDYTVRLYYKGEQLKQTRSKGRNTLTFTPLTSSTRYEVKLAAMTSAGTGPYSKPVVLKTRINATEAGVYALMVFSIVGIFMPSLITCILVASCYKVEYPCGCKRCSCRDEIVVPDLTAHPLRLPKHVNKVSFSSSGCSSAGDDMGDNKKFTLETRLTLETDEETDMEKDQLRVNTSRMLSKHTKRCPEFQTQCIPSPGVHEATVESGPLTIIEDAGQDQGRDIGTHDYKSSPVVENASTSVNLQPPSRDEAQGTEKTKAYENESDHALKSQFRSNNSFNGPQNKICSPISDRYHEKLHDDVKQELHVTVDVCGASNAVMKSKNPMSIPQFVLPPRNREVGYRNAISYI